MALIKENELLRRVKTAVHTLSPAAAIILYGSRARGTAHADSETIIKVTV